LGFFCLGLFVLKTKIAGSAFAVALVSSLGAQAADLPVKAPPPPPPIYNWTGGYLGAHVGAGIGRAHFSDPFGPSIFGDNVRTPAFLGGGQIGYNWQAPGSNWVFGVGDVSGLDSVGTNTCLAFSGLFFSANCRIRPDATATLTGRVGFAAGPEGHTLFYAKGGLAWVRDSIDITTNGIFGGAIFPGFVQGTSASISKWGGTVGVGVEQALTPAWSMKLEYDYLGFGGSNVATPQGLLQAAPGSLGLFLTPGGLTSVSQNIQEVKIGVNYRFGADPRAGWPVAAPAYPVKGLYKAPPPVVTAAGWEVEVGPRYWYSWGRFQKDLGGTTNSANANFLVSQRPPTPAKCLAASRPPGISS
jgi:opacity protein-like surface antigen